ncbi:hypothetical protein AVEN_239623-1 [Araneus ventricosus]|uniref:Uncharacterized protein n=1 Tax=Araneus ventricosus TaxID=182803 RepID=A0A4Y2W5P6_ARAVE|nr:hypothetical protein AVEN_239623-1 [Araneus ventricosus]
MRSDDIVNVMYRENFPRFSQSACSQRFSNSEKAMQGNKIRRQIAFAELRSATSSVGSRRKKLLDDHVNEFLRLEFSQKRYPVSMPRRFAGETSVNDRKFKGSGQNAVPTRALVPTGGYSTTAV